MGPVQKLNDRFNSDHEQPFSENVKEAVDTLVSTVERSGYRVEEGPRYHARIHYFPADTTRDSSIFAYLELMIRLRLARKAGGDDTPVEELFRHSRASMRQQSDGKIDLWFLYRTAPQDSPPSWAKTADAVRELAECVRSWTREFEQRVRR